jgi:hypothetical protein
MILKLSNPTAQQFPAGGWPFKDERTGFIVDGEKAFEQTWNGLADKIIRVRLANPHLGPKDDPSWTDRQSVIQEVFRYKAQTHPELFVKVDGKITTPLPPRAKVAIKSTTKCPYCESQNIEGIRCKTCGGTRIKGYKCLTCQKEWK